MVTPGLREYHSASVRSMVAGCTPPSAQAASKAPHDSSVMRVVRFGLPSVGTCPVYGVGTGND